MLSEVEAFEFASSDGWAAEFKAAAPSTIDPQAFNKQFEQAFALHSAPPTHQQWAADFQSFQAPPTVSELEKFNQAFTRLEGDGQKWTEEFEKLELKADHVKWVEKFKSESVDESKETAQSARMLLESLDLSDEKLAKCKFVAYLRELSESDPCLNGTFETGPDLNYDWKSQFLDSMHDAGLDQDREDDEWRRMDKAWEKFEFNGLGYEGFAPKEYSKYRFAFENEFLGRDVEELRTLLTEATGRDLKKTILLLEALCQAESQNANHWIQLGQAQAENEIDVQAIAAYYKAVELDAKNESALLGLAASCVNEYCVPDALEALEKIAVNNGLVIDAGGDRVGFLTGLYQNASFFANQYTRILALSILYNLAEAPEKAVSVLEGHLQSDAGNYALWNRLGASLANAKRYNDAIGAYERALSLFPSFVRGNYNMGISYMNQGNLVKALGFMIRALELHLPVDPQSGPLTDPLATGYQSIWNTIRIIGDMMDQEAINNLIEERDIVGLKNMLKVIS